MSKLNNLFLLTTGLAISTLSAQVNPQLLQQSIDKQSEHTNLFKYPILVKEFYQSYHYNIAWLGNELALRQLLNYIENAPNLGLKKGDYQSDLIKLICNRQITWPTLKDSLLADFRVTDIAIHFFHDAAFGNYTPGMGYNGLHYSPNCLNISSLLAAALSSERFSHFLEEIECKSPEYLALKNKIIQYNSIHNDTAYARTEELCRALNTVRWLRCTREQNEYNVIVNIPSATLLVLGKNNIAMKSKVIVGKKSTPTPTLCSEITEVVVYPYWMVPKKIATRELLPLIKLNASYLDANGFQVINQQGKIVDPTTIDWQKLNANYFPYTLRQSTGCDNSLGIIKLNFYNPYNVYLHDTPWKSLFNFNKRYFSHGCMRVEKAVELARLALKEKTPVMDTLIAKGHRPDQQPVSLTTPEKTPVFVLYNTAWVDSSANIHFYEDVYRKFSHPKKK